MRLDYDREALFVARPGCVGTHAASRAHRRSVPDERCARGFRGGAVESTTAKSSGSNNNSSNDSNNNTSQPQQQAPPLVFGGPDEHDGAKVRHYRQGCVLVGVDDLDGRTPRTSMSRSTLSGTNHDARATRLKDRSWHWCGGVAHDSIEAGAHTSRTAASESGSHLQRVEEGIESRVTEPQRFLRRFDADVHLEGATTDRDRGSTAR
jgi:hypothetical protein